MEDEMQYTNYEIYSSLGKARGASPIRQAGHEPNPHLTGASSALTRPVPGHQLQLALPRCKGSVPQRLRISLPAEKPPDLHQSLRM